jgi:Fur family iron response transcriptional regulator
VLFAKGHRHISAEDLHAEAQAAGVRISLATVYNALHQFTEAGLLREVAIDGTRTYFDTNMSDHHHFFVEGEGRLIDMQGRLALDAVPEPPEGMEVTAIEVVVRVRRRR